MAATKSEALRHGDTAFLGHPRGLGWLAFAEGWERFSYYGMQSLLVLYMTQQLLLPGHVENVLGFGPFRAWLEGGGEPMTPIALGSMIFAYYAGFVYLTPIIGGYASDRWFGRTPTIMAGCVLMTFGHFLMAF